MELDEILGMRRSIRKFDSLRPVERKELERLVMAAQEAPTWKNSQTGRYRIVTGAGTRAKLLACLHPQNQVAAGDAPALIVTSFVSHRSGFERDGSATNELGDGWGIYDLGLQNALLLLKATDLGLDTLVLGLRDADAIRQLLDIPEAETIVAIIAVGRRAIEPARPPRKELADIAAFFED